MKNKILIADPSSADMLTNLLKDNYNIKAVNNDEDVLVSIGKDKYDLVLLGTGNSGINVKKIMEEIESKDKSVVSIILLEKKADKNKIKDFDIFNFLDKPLDKEQVVREVANAMAKSSLKKEVEGLRKEIYGKYSFENIVAKSKVMKEILNNLGRVIDNDTIILITGESGTGKEIIARSVHYNSHRKNGSFITVDCGSIPDTLLESEFFGHEKGSATDPYSREEGKLEQASGGSLLLDEIHNLRMDFQAKLLRVLQDNEFSRLGGKTKVAIDCRIIATSTIDLEEAVNNGTFRKDLYYRISVIPIKLPSLRERKEDIPLLIANFLEKFNKDLNKSVTFSKSVFQVLQDYYWPGNIRELENMVQRLVVMKNAGVVEEEDLPQEILDSKLGGDKDLPDGLTLEELERKYIFKALREHSWNISKTARALAITRKTLHNKLNRYEEEGTLLAELQQNPR